MAKYIIQILCPSAKCWKCHKGERNFRRVIEERQLDAQIVYITELEEMLKFNTPFVPSFFVNNKVISRGLIPPLEVIRKFFDDLSLGNK